MSNLKPMTTTTSETDSTAPQLSPLGLAIAALALRLFVGLRLLIAGQGKFRGEEGYSFGIYFERMQGMVERMSTETFLPEILVYPYSYPLGFVQIAVGILLLVGYRLKWVHPIAIAILISLALGQMLLGNSDTVSHIALLLIIAVGALILQPWDRFRIKRAKG
jgi:uncharacterized membrane protein YphA (DoxX/SURF4 family)